MILKIFLHPVSKVSLILQKGGFKVQMSKFTFLKSPFRNILNRDSIIRVESSQIRQDLCEFGQPNQKADMNILRLRSHVTIVYRVS